MRARARASVWNPADLSSARNDRSLRRTESFLRSSDDLRGPRTTAVGLPTRREKIARDTFIVVNRIMYIIRQKPVGKRADDAKK